MSIKNNFLRNIIGFSISTWVGFGLSFLATPIITRIFLPVELGKINLFSTYLNLFMLIAYFGLDQAYIRMYKELPGKYSKNELHSFALMVSVLIGIILSLIIFIFHKNFSIEISGTQNFLISACLAVSLLTNIIMKYLNVYSRMENKIALYTVQSVSITFVSKVFFVVVAIWDPTHKNAIIALTLCYLFLTIIFLVIKGNNIRIPRYFDKKSAAALFRYGAPLMPVTLISWLNNSLAQFMLKYFVNFSAIGIYSNAVSIANTMNLIQTGFSTYWIPFVYSNYKENPGIIRKVHRYITMLICFLGIIVISFQDVIYLLLGHEYRSSKNFFPFLLMAPICFTIAETTGIGIGISKKSYLNIICFSSSLCVNALVCFTLLNKIGIAGAAIGVACSSIVLLVTKTILGEKYFNCISSYFQTFLPVLLIFVAAFVNYIYFYNIFIKFSFLIFSMVIIFIINKKLIVEFFLSLKK